LQVDTRKRSEADPAGKPCGDYIEDPDLQNLRDIWEKYLKPRIPDEARQTICTMAAHISGGEISTKDFAEVTNAVNRIQEAKYRVYEEIKAIVEPDPQPPTADQ
jgi:hypothetical protein